MDPSEPPTWVYVLAWLWVLISVGVAIQPLLKRLGIIGRLPTLGLRLPRRTDESCLVSLALLYVYFTLLLVFVAFLFFSGVAYVTAASWFAELNDRGVVVVGLIGAAVGYGTYLAVYEMVFGDST